MISVVLDDEDVPLPLRPKEEKLPKKTDKEKKHRIIEVVETSDVRPRKSSLMVSSAGKAPVRKRSVTILPPVGIKEEDSNSSEEVEIDLGKPQMSTPIDINKLKIGIQKSLDDHDGDIPPPPRSPQIARAFPDRARPPTPPNVSHKVRDQSPPKTPPSTPAV